MEYQVVKLNLITLVVSGMATGVLGTNAPPTFCQDGACDFFKICEKTIGRVVTNLQRRRGRGQNIFIYGTSFINLAKPLLRAKEQLLR